MRLASTLFSSRRRVTGWPRPDIRVARLRVIFELPEHVHEDIFDRLRIPRPGKLAYIEWFSKPGQVDDVTGMYTVRRAFTGTGQAARRQASVIESVDIRRSCHLVAKLIDGTLSGLIIMSISRPTEQYIDIEAFDMRDLGVLTSWGGRGTMASDGSGRSWASEKSCAGKQTGDPATGAPGTPTVCTGPNQAERS